MDIDVTCGVNITTAHGKRPRAGTKGLKSQGVLDCGQLDGVVGWVQGKLVAGARHPLSLLFNDYDVETTIYKPKARRMPELQP